MKVLYSLAIAAGLALSACAGQGPHIPGAPIFTSVSGPTAIGSGMGGKRSGEACGSNILGIVAIGDNSLSAAAKKGKISKISHADYSRMSILGIYTKVCTKVRGS